MPRSGIAIPYMTLLVLLAASFALAAAPLYGQEESAAGSFEATLMQQGWDPADARRLSAELADLVSSSREEPLLPTDAAIAARALSANRAALGGASDTAAAALELARTSAELRRVGVSAIERARVTAAALRSVIGERAASSGGPGGQGVTGLEFADEIGEAVAAHAGRQLGRHTADEVKDRLRQRGIPAGGGEPGDGAPDIPDAPSGPGDTP